MNNQKARLLKLFFLLLFAGCLQEKPQFAEIIGKVIDSQNQPIEGALVTVGESFATTSNTGHFTLSNIFLGTSGGCNGEVSKTITLSVQKDGYQPVGQTLSLHSGQSLVPDIQLVSGTGDGGGGSPANQPPTLTAFEAAPTTVSPSGTASLTVQATDPDGDSLSYFYEPTDGTISGTGAQVQWLAPTAAGVYGVTVLVTDNQGHIVTATVQITVTEGTNTAPILTAGPLAQPTSLLAGGSSLLTVNAFDADGDTLAYQWHATGGEITGSGNQVTFVAPQASGTFSIQVVVTDGKGGVASGVTQLEVTGSANQNPVISSGPTLAKSTLLPNEQTSVTALAQDPDGDPITYTWQAEQGVLSGSSAQVTYTAPNTSGSFAITLLVEDGQGGVAVKSVTVNVSPPNNAPSIDAGPTAAPSNIKKNDTVTIQVQATDPDNDPLVYLWTATDGTIVGSGATIQWIAPDKTGHYTLFVVVSDGKGGIATGFVTLDVD